MSDVKNNSVHTVETNVLFRFAQAQTVSLQVRMSPHPHEVVKEIFEQSAKYPRKNRKSPTFLKL
jgi:hypothetical protein